MKDKKIIVAIVILVLACIVGIVIYNENKEDNANTTQNNQVIYNRVIDNEPLDEGGITMEIEADE